MKTIDEIFDELESSIPWVTKSLMVVYKDICTDITNRMIYDKELESGKGNANNGINRNNEAAI